MQRRWLALGFALAAIASCSSAPVEPAPQPPAPQPEPAVPPPMRAKMPADSGAFYVPTSDPLHPRVHYVDGQDSLNDSCIVLTGNKLSRRVPPAYVNGRPVGFC